MRHQNGSGTKARVTSAQQAGGGRKLLPKHRVFRRDIPCIADRLPMESDAREYRAGRSLHKYFAGFFEKIWAKILEQYDKREEIGWKRKIMD